MAPSLTITIPKYAAVAVVCSLTTKKSESAYDVVEGTSQRFDDQVDFSGEEKASFDLGEPMRLSYRGDARGRPPVVHD
jgi:hypothetical protein